MSKAIEAKPAQDEKDYEAENAADTLMRAHEIKGNTELMKRVKKHAMKKIQAIHGMHEDIRSIDDLRAVKDKKFGSGKKTYGMDD